jgi:predicted HTH transcriptional regulator
MNALQCEMILALAEDKETISRRDVIEQLRVSNNRANYLLRKMKNANLLVAVVAKGRGAKYKLASRK